MKCSNHNQIDAIATCVFCGRALCPSCITKSNSGRVVCSPACSSGISATEVALESVRQKTLSANRLAAHLLIGLGILFGSFGLFAMSRKQWFISLYLIGAGVLLAVFGFILLRVASRKI